MITYKTGDILGEAAEALVNTVNCVGVMGRGLALQFKRNFPENFAAYARACREGRVQPGLLFLHREHGRWVINFPTKRHWKNPSRMEDIELGLRALTSELAYHRIESVAVPALGAGLGGLPWSRVRPVIERELSGLTGVDVTVYEPGRD